jgi:multimeric flavodoxin WrbA
MRRIVCLLGSPRPRGNSAEMAGALCQGAREAGAEVTVFALNRLDFRGCQGCMACKKEGSAGCALDDGLTPVLAAVAECDALVLATPVYFGEVSAQLKAFIDRTFSFLTPDYARAPRGSRSRLAPGKTLCFVIAQGHPREDLFTDIAPRYSYFLEWQGFTESRLLRAGGLRHAGAAEGCAGLMADAAELGRELAGITVPRS